MVRHLETMGSRWAERLLRWRAFPSALQLPLLIVTAGAFILALSPARRSEMNVGAALIWQLWWPFLPFFLLLTARAWCAVCPFPLLGNLVQFRKGFASPPPSPAARRWLPWMATTILALMGFFFLLLSLENNGPLTAILLLIFALGAAVVALLWQGRMWCRYLCPVGLMIGLYSRLAWLRLEARGGQERAALARGLDCPLFTSPLSPRREQDCVLCSDCLKGSGGQSVGVRVGPPSFRGLSLAPAEAVAVSLLMGLLLVDALRMTPTYLRYMVWAVPRTGGDYQMAMAVGLVALVAAILVVQAGVTLALERGRWSWQRFVQLSAFLLPLALATQLALSAQHLMAIGEVVRNLGAELGLLAPGHMPPSDAYTWVWPLKVLQVAMLAAGGYASLGQAEKLKAGLPGWVPAGLVALPFLVLATIFIEPMSVTC